MKIKKLVLALAVAPFSFTVLAGFEIEGTPALTTETGLMSNRTHYEQDARATFRMADAVMVPAQKKYEDANAKMVVDKAYRVVTHKGTGKAVKAHGYADSVPLDSALAMVIPAGWQVYQSADLKKEALPQAVSYEGGRDWPDVLASLGEYNALRFHIDWYDKVVMMGQGRPVYTSNLSRIRIIDEPVNGVRNRILGSGAGAKVDTKAKPVQVATVSSVPPSAVVTPVKAVKPVVTGASVKASMAKTEKTSKSNALDIETVSSCEQCVADRKKMETVSVSSAGAVKKQSVTAVAKPIPVGYSLFVREGFLHENISRLSKENGWNAPDWQIPSDFKVSSSFSVSANSFPEAVAKLLMIHPIEADVNTNQRKIYVTKEIQ